MNSRIDKLLCLRNGGLVVDAQGPITLWDPDEESAVVSIVITQVKANGTTAVATGSSGQILNGASGWSVTATAAAGSPLEFGPAAAAATATILEDTGAVEMYPWHVITRLVHCGDNEDGNDEGEEA